MGQEPAETSVHLPQGQDGQGRMAQIKEILVLVTSELCSRKGSHPILWRLDSKDTCPLASPFHSDALPFLSSCFRIFFSQDSFLDPRERSWES